MKQEEENIYAGFWRRLVAFLIDSALVLAALGVAWFAHLVGQILQVSVEGGEAMRESLLMLDVLGTLLSFDVKVENVLDLQLSLSSWAVWLLFMAAFESSAWQATPGKRIIGIKVTDYDGQRLDFPQALWRNFAKMFSEITLGLGYILAGVTRHKQALHDMLAKCFVIRD